VDTNTPPTIASTFSKTTVTGGTTASLSVTTNDDDGDDVTVNWSATGGSLNSADQGKATMRWTAPGAAGTTETITATATDGNGGQASATITVTSGTRWSANISGNVTWLKLSSPYLLDQAPAVFAITEGSTLTLQQGVEVVINKANTEVQVEGALITNGTFSEPVMFKPNAVSPSAGFWSGILVKAGIGGVAPNIDLKYTHITHAKNGVKAINNAPILVKNCQIKFCSEAAILHQSSGPLRVEDTKITNNVKSGIRIDDTVSQVHDIFVIRGDSIATNGDISGQTAYANGEAGISINLVDPQGLNSIDIRNNHISRNGFPGIRLTNTSFPVIKQNSIFGNWREGSIINFRLEPPYAAGMDNHLDVTLNYWAQLDSASVAATVFDRLDNNDVETFVDFVPFLDSEP
jgi:parallel beta-helix repeat protein